jgi:hypothetical protein
VKNILLIICFVFLSSSLVAQKKDYTEIHFKSKLRNYTKVLPKTEEIGINKELFSELVELLANDLYSENQKLNFTNKLWLAISNPQKFDYVYKDFSLKTIKNWGVKIKFEDPNFEPNPYLEKWTNTGDEYLYFQWASIQILTYLNLMAYGENGENAKDAITSLKCLQGVNPPSIGINEFTYDYLTKVSSQIKNKGLVILIYNNHYDFTVCKIEDKEKVIGLFEKLNWEFIDL